MIPANTFGNFYYPLVFTVTLVATFLAWWSPSLARQLNVPLFIVVILIIGIPHGATDHLLDKFSRRKNFTIGSFLLKYAVLTLMYGLLWYFFPLQSLILFVLMATYHFGQSQLLYVRIPHQHWIKVSSFFLWGSYVLTCLILINWAESKAILDELLPNVTAAINNYTHLIPLVIATLFVLNVALFVFFLFKGWMIKKEVAGELLNLLLFAWLAYATPLLVGFAIYFGLWHSLLSVQIEIQKVKTRVTSFNAFSFAKQALPLSLSSYALFLLI